MTIEITEDLIGMWFVPTIPDHQDWMLGASAAPDGKFQIEYRFRYYSPVGDGNPFNDEDEKNWYRCDCHARTPEEVVITCRKMAEIVSNESGGKLYEILMRDRDVVGFFKEMKQMRWAHVVTLEASPEGGWRCRCGHVNKLLFRVCESCDRPMTESSVRK